MNVHEDPYLASVPIRMTQNAHGVFELPCHHAVVHGEKLQFEPQAHKNTVGYWVDPNDWAERYIDVQRPGAFRVEILQGCGRGQGGSIVEISIPGESKLEFTVEETGHFQCFRWCRIGQLSVSASGKHQIQVKPVKRVRNAVMDLRRLRLSPIKEPVDEGKRNAKPNVVIFFSDDRGTLDAGCYGARDLFTPNIDVLAVVRSLGRPSR